MADSATAALVSPFGIEADHPRMSDLLLQSLPGCRLRSAIDGTKGAVDAKSGEYRIPLDQARSLAAFPKVPGMQLHVNPEECSYVILDPLEKDEVLLDRITKYLREQTPLRTDTKIRGVKSVSGKLDVHRMKTLCRELFHIVEAKEAKVVKGPKLDIDLIDELPGHYLLNPGLRTATTLPMYEKDWDLWVENLTRMGG